MISYHPALDRPLDKVRFLLGQTDEPSSLISDEEVMALFAVEEPTSRDILVVASIIANSLAARYAGSHDRRVHDISISGSQQRSGFDALASRLRDLLAKGVDPFDPGTPDQTSETPIIFAGGIGLPSAFPNPAFTGRWWPRELG